MTTDEALRRVDVERRTIDRMEEDNKRIRLSLKKNGIPFADLTANIPDSCMITEPLLQLYAEGRRVQAVMSERAYFEWLMQQHQIDINGDMEDGGKAQEDKMLEEILKCM